MKNYISEGRAIYEDINHGFFSRKLAEWAISRMKVKNTDGTLLTIKPTTLDQLQEILKSNNIKIENYMIYTAWYLYNMARADYNKSLPTEVTRANFVDETLNDPDGDPRSVLECFTAKMCVSGIPINWENYL